MQLLHLAMNLAHFVLVWLIHLKMWYVKTNDENFTSNDWKVKEGSEKEGFDKNCKLKKGIVKDWKLLKRKDNKCWKWLKTIEGVAIVLTNIEDVWKIL